MSTLYYARVERRNFGDLLSADGVLRLGIQITSEHDVLHAPHDDAILAVWQRDPRDAAQLPNLLVCATETEDDWAAWITTFAARIRPFSAYMRLLGESELNYGAKGTRTPILDRLLWPIAGLVLGEVLAASRLPDKSLETLSATACVSTLSFVMFRHGASSHRADKWSDLIAAWEFIRQATGQRTRPVNSLTVARVCATIMEAADLHRIDGFLTPSDRDIVDTCHQLIFSPQRVSASLSRISAFGQVIEMMHGSREDRVVAFERFVRQIEGVSGKESEIMPFVLGYLASQIAPGTIRHSSILAPVIQRYPAAILWYGFCAGIGEDVERRVIDFPSSARRVVRELLRAESVLDSPSCDMSFREFLALSRTGGNPLEGVVTVTPGTAFIELAPLVTTAVNVSTKAFVETPTWAPRERNIITNMGKQIERLLEMYRDLAGHQQFPGEEEQPSLFPARRKKR